MWSVLHEFHADPAAKLGACIATKLLGFLENKPKAFPVDTTVFHDISWNGNKPCVVSNTLNANVSAIVANDGTKERIAELSARVLVFSPSLRRPASPRCTPSTNISTRN